jgi:gluconolactonase
MAMHRHAFLTLVLTAVSVPGFSQRIQKFDSVLDQIVGPEAKLERVAAGFDKWTEGPVWTRQGTLLFAEIPANNIIQWIPGKGAGVFMHPSGYKGSEPFKGT